MAPTSSRGGLVLAGLGPQTAQRMRKMKSLVLQYRGAGFTVQGCLAHKKTPTPLGPP